MFVTRGLGQLDYIPNLFLVSFKSELITLGSHPVLVEGN